jgi:hypothetical protein
VSHIPSHGVWEIDSGIRYVPCCRIFKVES